MDQGPIVRLCELDDAHLEQAAALLVDGFYDMFKGISKDRAVLRRLFAPCMRRDRFFVLLADGRTAGLVAVSDCRDRAVAVDGAVCAALFGKTKGKMLAWQLRQILGTPAVRGSRSGYIDFLVTAPDHRRQGAAARLLAAAEEDPAFTDLYLDVLASNAPAIALYEKTGYRTEQIKKDLLMRLAGVGPMYIMKKELA